MDRKKIFFENPEKSLFSALNNLHFLLSEEFSKQFRRSLPFTDEVFDRWERAEKLGFGKGSSIYDSSYVFGEVTVGDNTWLGQYTIIDGSGKLTIGNNCTISAGVHIYTHDNLKQTLIGKKNPIDIAPVTIGNNTYIGPQCIITKGIRIGNHCVLAANSFLNKNMEDNTIYAGNPARKIGLVIIKDNEYTLQYH